MRWVASTGVICSLFFSSCTLEQSTLSQNDTERPFLIGVQTELLSLNTLSVNSLGENLVLDLIEPKLFYFDESNELKSFYGVTKFNGKTLFSNDSQLNKALLASFKKIKGSPLWSSNFKDFTIEKAEKIACKLNEFCLDKFVSLIGLLRSTEFADYEVTSFDKTRSVSLNKINKDAIGPQKINVVRFKKALDALLYLSEERLDLFHPNESVASKNNDLVFKSSDHKYMRLSLYKKSSATLSKDFKKSFCNSEKTIKKSFSDWKTDYSFCKNKSNIRFKSKKLIKVVSDTKLVIKMFDIIFQNKPINLKIDYKFFKAFKLTNVLKKGDFDLYLTEEQYDESYNLMFEAYHSKGVYNTLKISNKALDKALDKTKKMTSFSDYFAQQKRIKKALDDVEPLVLRLRKPFYEFIYNKNSIDSKELSYFVK